jgi:protoheme IX farnesyltransferase
MATEAIRSVVDGTVRRHSDGALNVLADYWSLAKPEINLLIAITTAAAFCIGSRASLHFSGWLLLRTLVGTVLVASGAGVLNEVIEWRSDAQMRRTARRPIVAGRIEPTYALIFGMLLSLVGGLYLGFAVRPAASLLALIALGGYLLVYTPLKRCTPLCTLAGAFPGAMPVLIGYVAATGKLDSQAWLLYTILFLWQFPHFMAIAWMYREDYARAGYKVLPLGRERAWFMVWQSVVPTLILLSVTVVQVALRRGRPTLMVGTFLLSVGFLYFAARLALFRSRQCAHQLLLVSVIYLPLVFALQVLARV